MNDKTRFFRSGILLTLVALSMRTVSMFFAAYVSRTVGAEGTGLYTLVMTVYSFAVTFATSGISLTVTRLVASAIGEGAEADVKKIMKGALIYSGLFGIAATLFLFFGANFLGSYVLDDIRTVTSLKVLAFSLVPIALGSVFSGYFVGVKRVSFNALVQVLAQFSKIFLTVIVVTKTAGRGITEAVVALCFCTAATELIAFLIIFIEYLYDRRKNGKQILGNSFPAIKSVAQMALPLAFSAYVRSVLLNIEHILIPRKLRESGESTSEAYAHYGILHGMAIPLIMYPMSPLSSFSGLLVPEFAEDMAAGRKERMNKIASLALNTTLTYAIIVAVFIFTFSEELGYTVYKSYDAGYYISTLALVVPIMYLDHVTDSVLKGIGEHVFSMWVNISDSFLSVILVWFLIPKLGIMGYAVVIVIMEGYNFILSVTRLAKRIKFKINIAFSIIVPLLSALLSAYLTRELFAFGGSSARPLWLILEMVFALALTTAFMSAASLGEELKKEKRKIT